jgi:hypothetical protein
LIDKKNTQTNEGRDFVVVVVGSFEDGRIEFGRWAE